jgi:hypothetical protein
LSLISVGSLLSKIKDIQGKSSPFQNAAKFKSDSDQNQSVCHVSFIILAYFGHWVNTKKQIASKKSTISQSLLILQASKTFDRKFLPFSKSRKLKGDSSQKEFATFS